MAPTWDSPWVHWRCHYLLLHPNRDQFFSPFCSDFNSVPSQKNWRQTVPQHFYLPEKRSWSKSKRENSSSDRIGFRFCLSVSFSLSPLPALGLHPEVGSIVDIFQQIIEDKDRTLYVVGFTTHTGDFTAPFSLDMQTFIPWLSVSSRCSRTGQPVTSQSHVDTGDSPETSKWTVFPPSHLPFHYWI